METTHERHRPKANRTRSPGFYLVFTDSLLLFCQEAVVDSLGISTVLEGCRQLTKVAFNQINLAESVFEHMGRKTKELQVNAVSLQSDIISACFAFALLGCQSYAQGTV